jgi:hypothetical protein
MTTPIRKKLIEVSIPLEAINSESSLIGVVEVKRLLLFQRSGGWICAQSRP